MEKVCLTIIKFGIIAALFTPFIIWSNFLYPYIFPKNFLFQIIIEVVLFFYLILAAQNPKYRPRLNSLLVAVGLLAIILILSSILGVNFYRSFWGNAERMSGIFTYLHFFALFLILASVFKEKKDWFLIFDSQIFVGLLLTFYGFAQKLNLSFVRWTSQPRIDSTTGNPDFFGSFLMINIFFLLFLFFQKKSKNWRIFYGALLILEIIALYFSETRAAVIGLAAGVLTLFICLALFSKKIRKPALAVILILLILGTSLVLLRNQSFIKGSTLHRFINLEEGKESIALRALAWKPAWDGWKDNFLLGSGLEHYAENFNRHFDPNLCNFPGTNWYDRAHNLIFDWGAMTGILGFLSYFSLYIISLILLWNVYYRREKEIMLPSIFTALIVGYFAQGFFIFDTLNSYIPLFLFFGFIYFIGSPKILEEKKKHRQQFREPNYLYIFILFLVLIFVIYQFNIRPVQASMAMPKVGQINVQNYIPIIERFKKSLSYQTFLNEEIIWQLDKFVLRSMSLPMEDELKINGLKFAREKTKEAIKANPFQLRNPLNLSRINQTLINLDGKNAQEYSEEAKKVLVEAMEYSPTRWEAYFELAQLSLISGDVQNAISYYNQTFALNLNQSQDRAHWNLAIAYFQNGEEEKAEEEIERALEVGYQPGASQYAWLGQYYFNEGKNTKAIDFYKKAIEKNPQNGKFYYDLGNIYLRNGQVYEGIENLEKAKELDPSLAKQVDRILAGILIAP